MGQRCSWVQATKCQLLVTSLFGMLLGLSVAILTTITYYEKHFIVISEVLLETNPMRTFLNLVLYAGICLSSLLTIAAILSVIGTWRDLESAMAVGFLCFAVVFCASVQAAYWAITNGTEFLCCGKKLQFEEERNIENETCQSEITGTANEDCLQAIHNILKKHMRFVSIVMIITTIIMVYGMILTSFLCFSIHFNNSLDRKDKYVLTG
ncbi:tetraspanin-32 isoform X2 [Sphaerodactylus townsendi]|uniref:tetraspanin-32 isoform X2 n=1 Tax=Sphaerodactylus townsendi TaxID=933632 RepID=UPI0020260EC0|nr:tetraspanin-32 isoform X2 [Sphaerodactylus townsendi]